MQTTSLSSKGQVVLPQKLRDAYGWKPGTSFEVRETPNGVLLTPISPATAFAPTTIDAVFGMAATTRPALSVDEMAAVVDAEAARRR